MKTAHFEPLKTFLSCLNSKQFLVTGMEEGGGGVKLNVQQVHFFIFDVQNLKYRSLNVETTNCVL